MSSQLSHKPQFYVDGILPAQADEAYPLIRALAPEVTLEAWRDYVQRRYRTGGLLGLHDENGGIVGVLSYRLGERLRHGLVLALDDFVTFELSQSAPGRRALLAAAEQLGKEMGCTGLEVRVAFRGLIDDHGGKAHGWTSLGLSPDSAIFVKPLDARD